MGLTRAGWCLVTGLSSVLLVCAARGPRAEEEPESEPAALAERVRCLELLERVRSLAEGVRSGTRVRLVELGRPHDEGACSDLVVDVRMPGRDLRDWARLRDGLRYDLGLEVTAPFQCDFATLGREPPEALEFRMVLCLKD